MIIIPLGLGTRVPKFPLITAILCISIIGIYFFGADIADLDLQITKIYEKNHIASVTKDIFIEFCIKNGGEKDPCRYYGEFYALKYKNSKDQEEGENKLKEEIKKNFENKTDKKKLKLKNNSEENLKEIFDILLVELNKYSKYSDIIKEFSIAESDYNNKLNNLKNYEAFKEKKFSVDLDTIDLYNKYSILSSRTLQFKPLIRAQFQHGNFWHLAFNLLFLIFFGVYVEQRTRPLVYLGSYFAGGTIGLGLYTLYYMNFPNFVVGASANISAIIGMFFVFFFNYRMKILLFYGFARVIYAPIKVIIPLLFIAFELIHGISNHVEGGGSIAHFAHLIGMGAGIIMGMIICKISPIRWPFIYPFEENETNIIKHTVEVLAKIKLAQNLLAYNPENDLVKEDTIKIIIDRSLRHHLIPQEYGKFLSKYLQGWLAVNIRSGKIEKCYNLLADIPIHIPMASILGNLGHINILKLGDYSLNKLNYPLAMRMYDFYIFRHPYSYKIRGIMKTIEELIDALPKDQNTYQFLHDYLKFNPHIRITHLLLTTLERLAIKTDFVPEETTVLTEIRIKDKVA